MMAAGRPHVDGFGTSFQHLRLQLGGPYANTRANGNGRQVGEEALVKSAKEEGDLGQAERNGSSDAPSRHRW